MFLRLLLLLLVLVLHFSLDTSIAIFFLQSDDVVMDLTKLFQCSLMEEFKDIMSNSVKSMSVDSTSEWWAQRTRLDTKMKVKHVTSNSFSLLQKVQSLANLLKHFYYRCNRLIFNHNHTKCTKETYSIG